MERDAQRKLLRAACHASALTSWTLVMIGLPIGILFYSDDPLVKDSAKEALNFIISQAIWSVIFVLLCMSVIGIPLGVGGFWLLGIVTLILPIVAIASVIADPDKPFRYPWTFRLIPSGNPRLTQDTVG